MTTATTRTARRTATRALEELVAEVDGERLHAGTVGELLERWFAASSPGWAATTAAHTRSIIDCHLQRWLGDRPVAALTTAEVDELYARLLTGGGADGRGLAPSTVRRIHGVLHRALGQALLASVRDWPLLFCLLRLAATTGARRGQLLALRWRDIDLQYGTVAFTRALVVGPDGPVLAPTKTERTHQVDLDGETLRVVCATHAVAVEHAAAAGCRLSADAFVFTHDAVGGRPWLPGYATHKFGDARRAAGLPQFRLHDVRHFMATQMQVSGVASDASTGHRVMVRSG